MIKQELQKIDFEDRLDPELKKYAILLVPLKKLCNIN
jgi:hypothetical protein